MKINGTATVHRPVEQVWSALTDPGVLVQAIPGCTELVATGADHYRMTVTAGVASVKGTYVGEVRLADQRPPGGYTLHATGSGTPGTVDARCQVRLVDQGDGTTRVEYAADAAVGGVVAGVGQRVLAGVARKMAGEFFAAVDGVLVDGGRAAAGPAPAAAGTADTVPAGAAPAGAGGAAAGGVAVAGTRFVPPPGRAGGAAGTGAGAGGGEFARGAAVGALAALAGVLVGAAVARRRG